jgi:uncharacterized membrane protein YfcA
VTSLYLALGIAAGILAGLFGIGGGVVMVIGMATLLKQPFLTAVGTSLAAMLLPVGALGAWEYWRQGHVDVRAAAWLAGGLFLGAWLGARLATDIAPSSVQRMFAVFLLATAIRMWVKA